MPSERVQAHMKTQAVTVYSAGGQHSTDHTHRSAWL